MGLGDLIRKVHGPDKLSVMLDQFIMAREKASPPREYGWHPSEFVGMCARQAVLISLAPKVETDPFPPGLLRIFNVGSALHEVYQNQYFGEMRILWGKWECLTCGEIVWGTKPLPSKACEVCESKGRWNYLEIPFKANLGKGITKCIVGHSDGIVFIQGRWYLIEIKSINDNGFTWQKHASPKHVLQAQVYGELYRQGMIRLDHFKGKVDVPEIAGIIIWYVNKNNSWEREYRLEFDQDTARAELKKPYLVERALMDRELPPRREECANRLQKPAKQCSMVSYCFGGSPWNQRA